MNKTTIFTAILIAGLIIAGAIVFNNYQKCPDIARQSGQPGQEPKISQEEAGKKVIDFINNNILRDRATASLVQALEESDFYKIRFEVEGQEIEWLLTKNGKFLFPEVIDLTEVQEAAKEVDRTIGNFSVSSDEVCLENEKPIVYFFGSQNCPHCTWEHPIIEEVAGKFNDYISFHNNMDSGTDMEVFQKYSTGSIPTLVLGCRYYRVGSGEAAGKEQEIENLTSLICELTNKQPAEICRE